MFPSNPLGPLAGRFHLCQWTLGDSNEIIIAGVRGLCHSELVSRKGLKARPGRLWMAVVTPLCGATVTILRHICFISEYSGLGEAEKGLWIYSKLINNAQDRWIAVFPTSFLSTNGVETAMIDKTLILLRK